MGEIKINPKNLAELINELTAYKNNLDSKNSELITIKRQMNNAWEEDSQYNEVGRPALEGIIKVNGEVIELLGSTLNDLSIWLEAVNQLIAESQRQMM